jgi:hypothetical protein
MEYFGLKSLVINSDTISAASSNLWVDARSKYTMVLLSPEELNSDGFRDLLKQKMFFDRVCMFGVDEIHLIFYHNTFAPMQQIDCNIFATNSSRKLISFHTHFYPLTHFSPMTQ